MALIDNLISYWKMDWNSNDSHSINNWTDTSISYVTWLIWSGAEMNATSDYIAWTWTFPTWTNPSTVSFRVKITEAVVADYRSLFWYGTASSNAMRNITTYNGSIYISQYWYSSSAIASYTLNQWMHIVFVYDWTKFLSYINWVYQTWKDWTYSINTTWTTRQIWCGTFTGAKGIYDEVWIWGRALSAGEVTQLYNWWAWFAYPFTPTFWTANSSNRSRYRSWIGGIDAIEQII